MAIECAVSLKKNHLSVGPFDYLWCNQAHNMSATSMEQCIVYVSCRWIENISPRLKTVGFLSVDYIMKDGMEWYDWMVHKINIIKHNVYYLMKQLVFWFV